MSKNSVKIAASSVLKIVTPSVRLDYTYPKGIDAVHVAADLIRILLIAQGKKATQKIIDDAVAQLGDKVGDDHV